MTHASVTIQVDPGLAPSPPAWLEEVAAFAHILAQVGILSALSEQVHFARARFGLYETLDFALVLLCYALSGEPTLLSFYQRLAPFTQTYLLLFGRKRLPSRSALSRFLAALPQQAVEALRTQFQSDLFDRPTSLSTSGGLWDRQGQQWIVVDVDGTRQATRQRALPDLPTLPEPQRRFEQVSAKGYTGRKRGEVVRTRTVVLQSHTQQWLGTFAGAGNGDVRGELQRACQVACAYAASQHLHPAQILIRLDGGYGDTVVVSEVLSMGLGVIVRSRDYGLLGRLEVQAALMQQPVVSTNPASKVARLLYECPSLCLRPGMPPLRLLITTHPATEDPPKIGKQREGLVYELFLSTVSTPALHAQDLLDLYLHRGGFETVLADEDQEQDADRWCSRTRWGQECWQILSQWVWNLRQELGQQVSQQELRTTEQAEAGELPSAREAAFALEAVVEPTLLAGSQHLYGPPQWARASFTGGFPGSVFTPQEDGTLLCPAGHVLTLVEQRRERADSIRVSYIARLEDCRACPFRPHCQDKAQAFSRARRVSAVYWPIPSHPLLAPCGSPPPPACAPVLWRDWPRRQMRRLWIALVRSQTVEVKGGTSVLSEEFAAPTRTRTQRAHWRLAWEERLARNAHPASSSPVVITLHGLPPTFAQNYGFPLCTGACRS